MHVEAIIQMRPASALRDAQLFCDSHVQKAPLSGHFNISRVGIQAV
jgi:hypothetical protein